VWVCGAEGAECAVGGNGCEVGIRRHVRKDEGEKLKGASVCVPQVIVRRILRPVAEEAEGS